MNTITVIEKKPGERAHTRQIENTLKAFQEAVGGYIETVTVASDMAIVCNEEGRLRGMPYNCSISNMPLVGTILFAGVDGDEFADIPTDLERFEKVFLGEG